MGGRLHRLIASLAAPLLLAACASSLQERVATATAFPSHPGVVSAADPRAAEAGVEILRAGGSAADAAIATMLALSVVEPQSSGIGGGGVVLYTAPDGKVASFDGRETAPLAATGDWFLDKGAALPFQQAKLSGLSVGVPGNIRLAALLHGEHGRLGWARLFDPAIRLARDGFAITPRLAEFLARERGAAGHDEEGRRLFYDASGNPLPVGALVRNPPLAETLERIARNGPDSFYRGAAANALAREVAAATPRAVGMTAADIAAYRAKERGAVCGPYRTYRICGMGPPSSGATTVLAILKQLERFDLAALGPQSPVAWHLFAESQRLAYADRELYLADGDFVAVPVAGLTDPAYLAARSTLISADSTIPAAQPGTPPGVAAQPADGAEPEEHGTSHFVAVDRAGDVVSYTSTIEGPFGSGIMVGGYFLNNELTDFSFAPDKDGKPVANRVEGGKRPRSSMAPTLVFGPDGRMVLAVGAAGGPTIPVQVARVIIGVIDWKLPAKQAIALPVLFVPGDTLFIEPGSALEAMVPALRQLGHATIVPRAMPLKTNAVEWGATGWIGAADPRSEGAAASE